MSSSRASRWGVARSLLEPSVTDELLRPGRRGSCSTRALSRAGEPGVGSRRRDPPRAVPAHAAARRARAAAARRWTTPTGPTRPRCATSSICRAPGRPADRGARRDAPAGARYERAARAARGGVRTRASTCRRRSARRSPCWCATVSRRGRRLLRALLGADGRQPAAACASCSSRSEQAGRRGAGSGDRAGRALAGQVGAAAPRRSPAAAQALARAVAVFEDDAPMHLAAALAELTPGAAASAADELEHADVLRGGRPAGLHPSARASGRVRPPGVRRARADPPPRRAAARRRRRTGRAGERASAARPPAGDEETVGVLLAAARRAMAQGVPLGGPLPRSRAARAAGGRPSAPTCWQRSGGRRPSPDVRRPSVTSRRRSRSRRSRASAPRCCSTSAGRCITPAASRMRARRSSAGSTSWARTRDTLAADLEGAYLTSAMHVANARGRCPPPRRRDPRRLRPATRADRELASTAMMMWLFAGRPRDDILAVARRLDAAGGVADGAPDSRTPPYVIGTLIWCDDFGTAADALALTFADARRRGSVRRSAMASPAALAPAALDRPDRRRRRRRARRRRRLARGRQMYLHAADYCLVRALLEHDEPDAAATSLALGDAEQPASAVLRRLPAHGAGHVAVQRGDDAAALEAFLTRPAQPDQAADRQPGGAAVALRGRAGRRTARPPRRGARADRGGAAARRAVRRAARRSGWLAAPPPCSTPATPRSSSSATRATGSAPAARVSTTRARWSTSAPRSAAPGETPRRARTLRQALALAETTAPPRSRGAPATSCGSRAAARARASARLGGLTPSEHRVAVLAAAGQTNRQIADELFLTVKSVEWHLGNTYRKLDIRGRGGARRAGSPNPGGGRCRW